MTNKLMIKNKKKLLLMKKKIQQWKPVTGKQCFIREKLKENK